MNPATARIALSYEACELSDLARAAVPTNRSTAEALSDAAQILQAAQRLFAAAVLAADAENLPWPEISAVLTPRTHLLMNPQEAAEDLDDWVTRHPDAPLGPSPVSQILG